METESAVDCRGSIVDPGAAAAGAAAAAAGAAAAAAAVNGTMSTYPCAMR